MDDDFDEFDFSQPLQFALSRLNGVQMEEEEEEEEDLMIPPVQPYSHFPKPSSISGMVAYGNVVPRTAVEVLDEIVDTLDNYPRLIQLLMQRGFLKKGQICKKCDKPMHLRRRKNMYEWRCRTRDKRDCSSCSIKLGSWFEATKLPLKAIFNFLIMYSKNCSTGFIVKELKISTHIVNELRRVTYELTDRMMDKNMMVGGYQKVVYMEIITVGGTKGPVHKVLAGQEVDSTKCFAKVLPNENPATIEAFSRQNIIIGSNITVVVTVNEQSMSYANQSAEFLDETTLPNCTMFFTNIRKLACEAALTSPKTLQTFLNDQVIRRVTGIQFLEKCVDQLKSYVVQDD